MKSPAKLPAGLFTPNQPLTGNDADPLTPNVGQHHSDDS
jgi:hypothetical protein